ncbi:MAG: hypothetical protein ACXWCY_16195 [Burkholderiales bacterium]
MKTKAHRKVGQSARSHRRTIGQLVQERGSIAQFARDLSQISGEEVTWARVNNWILRDSVSKNMAVHVHKLTRAPLADLLS